MDFINSSSISTYYGDIFEKYDITHVMVYKNYMNNSNIQNGNNDELSTKQYKYIFEEEKKKNFLCCIKCQEN